MFWKILFYLYSAGLLYFGFLTGISRDDGVFNCSEPLGFAVALSVTFVFVVFTLLYSLAFRFETYNKKTALIILILTAIFNICAPVLLCTQSSTGPDAGFSYVLATIITTVIFILLTTMVLSFVYAGFFSYLRDMKDFVKNTSHYLKSLALFSFLGFYLPVTLCRFHEVIISKTADTTDIIAILFYIFTSIFLIGTFREKMFFNKRFWQWSFIPYIFVSIFVLNGSFRNIDGLKEILQFPFTLTAFLIILFIFLYKILYDYAFAKAKKEAE